MSIYTFHITKSICELLDIDYPDTPELSDQNLCCTSLPISIPYGGGGRGEKNGHYGCKHSNETKEKIRQARLGKSPANKGIPNPTQREKMLRDNPMKNPDIVAKAIETRKKNNSWIPHSGCFKKGIKPHNYVDEMKIFYCDTCGNRNIVRNVKGGKTRRFCNRSCQATFTNTNRRGFKG